MTTNAPTTNQLEKAFQGMGLSPKSSAVAALGRAARPTKAGSLVEAARELGHSAAAARTFARGRSGFCEAVKNIAGLSSRCFAWVPDENDPLTWQLQIARSDEPSGAWQPDEDLVRAACGQVPGIATYGKALDIPTADLPAVKATLRAAWIACGASIDEMPAELQQEGLRRAFVGLGLSETEAATAARGRERRR